MSTPLAVCVLFVNQDHALAVSRRNDPTKWGLPGGKVDPGETSIQAAIRETQEEIGFTVHAHELQELFNDECNGNVVYDVKTYLYLGTAPPVTILKPETELSIAYLPFDKLQRPQHSPFSLYNIGVFEALNHADVRPIR